MRSLWALPADRRPHAPARHQGEDTLLGKAQRILDEKGAGLTDDAPTMVINDLAARMYYILHQLLLTVALTLYVVAVSLSTSSTRRWATRRTRCSA